MNPWRRRKSTFWPILLYNFNLPPEERSHDDNAICVGEVPGPEKPKDMDSFLYPAIQELLKLSVGVRAYDVIEEEIFILHAYLLTVFGDIPAVSMLLRMKGHNARSPCRLCMIQGIRIPGSRTTTHYVPLCRKNLQTNLPDYDPTNLPPRTHEQFMEQAHKVQSAETNTTSERLATEYGINGIPLLSVLDSLSLPLSTGYEFMHLVFENLIPNLALLWSGNFKGLNKDQPFVFSKTVWEAIGTAAAASRSTMPSSYGAPVPNVATDRSSFSAETWSQWALFVGPVVLNGRFPDKRYHDHFCDLIKLINLCLKFEFSKEDIVEIREGFIRWVEKYEAYAHFRLYPQLPPLTGNQVLLSIRARPAPMHDSHGPWTPSRCRHDRKNWPRLGLVVVPHRTSVWATTTIHHQQASPLCKSRQPHHTREPIQNGQVDLQHHR